LDITKDTDTTTTTANDTDHQSFLQRGQHHKSTDQQQTNNTLLEISRKFKGVSSGKSSDLKVLGSAKP
jgi:hypothetical protein